MKKFLFFAFLAVVGAFLTIGDRLNQTGLMLSVFAIGFMIGYISCYFDNMKFLKEIRKKLNI